MDEINDINDITVNKQSKAKEPFGRPVGTGKYSESTSVIRVPNTQKPVILNFLEAYEKSRKRNTELDDSFYSELASLQIAFNEKLSLPLGGTKLDAGFGNMIEDWMEDELEIKDYLVDDIEMSFLKIIGGLSMNLAGLLPGTVAVVDRSKDAQTGDIVMAELNGKETVKYLGKSPEGNPQLIPHSTENFPIMNLVTITEYDDFRVVGVINTWFMRRNKPRKSAKLR